ncbi:RDD family protein [Zooshikella marina]|uniref:RDD family protein n=2 Tax=Zooshikella ganghwensis TaxID=202772 RepID=UPI001BAFE9F7|nr:RDD family protein [Zooshikella ganghwensis]MBU2709297.1 RDD family protein [Zooshikella ganghwensis]
MSLLRVTNQIYKSPEAKLSQNDIAFDELKIAGTMKRFVNMIIDLIFLIITLFVVVIVILQFINVFGASHLEEYLLNEKVITLITFLVYFVPQEAIWGRTLGKLITQTKVVNRQGLKPNFFQVVIRTLCRLIPFDMLSFGSKNDRPVGWHDKIPRTYVIDVEKLV